MISVSLTKGVRVDMSKVAPNTTTYAIGLGWKPQQYDGKPFDLDAMAFLIDASGNVTKAEDFVYFHNLTSACKSVTHSGDNLTGDGDGDDEVITFDTTKVDTSKYVELLIAVNIFEAGNRGQTFGQVDDAYVRVFDPALTSPADAKAGEICRYDLTEDYSIHTAIVVGKMYFKDGTWRFQAVGGGYTDGMTSIMAQVGMAAK